MRTFDPVRAMRRVKQLTLGFVAMACVAIGLYSYAGWADRVAYLRWVSARQMQLRDIGKRIQAYAATRGGREAPSVDELIASGVLSSSELEFEDLQRMVHVKRIFQIDGVWGTASSKILIVESYFRSMEYGGLLLQRS